MPKTQLLRGVAALFQENAVAAKPTRRRFLRSAAALAALPAAAKNPPRIAVVGGGLAGLTCAYRLKQAGLNATVYEASDRAGGRCWTLRGHFNEGQFVERGGELIDQGHTAIRHLAQELRLPLDNLLAAEVNGSEPLYYFQGKPYAIDAARKDIKQIWKKLHRDLSEASYPTTYYESTQRGRELDLMSIRDWILESVPGGYSAPLAQLLDVAYNIEYGAETEQQSALNLIYLLGYRGQGQIRLFGPSNEKYRVRGGNDRIVTALAAQLQGQVQYGRRLASINRNLDGTYALGFNQGPVVVADRVVLALPFSILRSSVNFANAGFSPRKQQAIAELGMGQNAKQHLQFTSRRWNKLGGNGDSYADTGYQITWEVTRGQSGTGGHTGQLHRRKPGSRSTWVHAATGARANRARHAGLECGLQWQESIGALALESTHAGLVLFLEAGSVSGLRRCRRGARRRRPLLRRAHVTGFSRLSEWGRGFRGARRRGDSGLTDRGNP